MKVDLEKLVVGHSPLTDNFFVGTLEKPGVFRNKHDVTNHVISAVISRWEGVKEVISSGDQRWEISVKKLPPKDKSKNNQK